MGFFTSTVKNVNWTPLELESQLEELIEESVKIPVLIFKHSTRCSISSFVLKEFEMDWDSNKVCKCYFLDLIQFRSVSNAIAEKLHVVHQSPQVILLMNKEVVYSASHQSISAQKISSYF